VATVYNSLYKNSQKRRSPKSVVGFYGLKKNSTGTSSASGVNKDRNQNYLRRLKCYKGIMEYFKFKLVFIDQTFKEQASSPLKFIMDSDRILITTFVFCTASQMLFESRGFQESLGSREFFPHRFPIPGEMFSIQ